MAVTPSPTAYLVGDDGVAMWSDRHADAWIGLLETHKQLTRLLDAELDARYGLSLSGLELLARLGAAPERCLRLSALAAAAGLSLSRVSRLAGTLEARGLISREPCSEDARAVEARLTPAGLELMRSAQRTHFASVQREFFDRVSSAELDGAGRSVRADRAARRGRLHRVDDSARQAVKVRDPAGQSQQVALGEPVAGSRLGRRGDGRAALGQELGQPRDLLGRGVGVALAGGDQHVGAAPAPGGASGS